MAKLRLRSLPLSLLALLAITLSGVTASSPSPKEESASNPSASPAGNVDLICHTNNPAECYPKIFQATDEFQLIRDDQDIPQGLHIRLNIQTGQKEAKINVPDEINPALEGLPVDTSVVIVPHNDDDESQEAQHAPKVKIPANAPRYDPAGKIKPASGSSSGDDSGAFYRSLSVLKKGLNVDEALEMLEDISHDIYYGLKIAEDYDTVQQLFCLANTGAIFDASSAPEVLSRARLAALTIASAVQNNPKALDEIEKHWTVLPNVKCPAGGKEKEDEVLSTAAFRLVSSSNGEATRNDASVAKARVSAISGLLKNAAIRAHFLSHGGMELVLEVLVGADEAWEPAQRKAALLVLDNFLDENMGAALGEWPTQMQATDKECAARGEGELHGDCWDWQAKTLANRYKKTKNHWSGELLKQLKEQRKANTRRKGKDEL